MKPPRPILQLRYKRKDQYALFLGVHMYPDSPHTFVTVEKTLNDLGSGKSLSARINWPAIGSVTPDQAELFAKAILRAAREARKLDRRHPPDEAKP